MTKHVLHFKVGPVQAFIGQARRTRDLWAGSFLLSCLTGMAMRAVAEGAEENQILYPQTSGNPLFDALVWDPRAQRPVEKDSGPVVGSLPNHFKAEVDDWFDPDSAAQQVHCYWRHIADVVRERVLPGNWSAVQCEIWRRQIDGFFDINWVKGVPSEEGDDGAWLDRRWNWHSKAFSTEPGDHCMLIGELQELSGFVQARGEGGDQQGFWSDISERIEAYLRNGDEDRVFATLELGPTERLSAVALVKRLFPILKRHHLREALGFVPGGTERREIRYWPSLAGIAAAPWLSAAHDVAQPSAAGFVACIRRAEQTEEGKHASALSRAERNSPISRLRRLKEFGDLDGKLFYDFAIDAAITDTERGWLAENRKDQAQLERNVYTAARSGLRELLLKVGHVDSKLAEGPKPFLALLRMDGDRVGQLLGPDGPGEERVSESLSLYTVEVETIVQEEEGVLIYAGGDDVLALFSIDRALKAACALHAAYSEAFQQAAKIRATTSAGIAFAHFGVPFTRITEESRRLLEDVAKARNGRDSIAVSVTKQSGRQIEWCTAFDSLQGPAEEPFFDLVTSFGRRVGEEQRFSSFVYNMRERYQAYLEPDRAGPSPPAGLVHELMLAEWLKGENTDREGFDLGKEQERLRRLQAVCETWRNDDARQVANAFRMDGALLIKFLDDNLITRHAAPADV